jgi:hypothetical protein
MTLMHWYLLAGFAVCLVLGILGMDLLIQASEDSTEAGDREAPATTNRILRFPGVAANSERPNSDHPQEAA